MNFIALNYRQISKLYGSEFFDSQTSKTLVPQRLLLYRAESNPHVEILKAVHYLYSKIRIMTKTFTLLPIIFLFSALQAQDFAEDWTKTDCDGIDHTLFTELDNGNCVILAFDMLPTCTMCIDAADLMDPVVEDYRTLHPDSILFYCLAYVNTYSCATMQTWESDNGFNHDALFEDCADDVAYYGGMGMPTIVVLGKNTHEVFYNVKGFGPGDIPDFEAAIDEVFAKTTTDINTNENNINIKLYPNPATETVMITYENIYSIENISLMDLKGNKVIGLQNPALNNIGNMNTITFDIASVPNGIYFIQLTGNGISHIEKVIVNH